MKELSLFTIPYVGLKLGEHLFNYELDSTFFNSFENSIIKKANLKVEVVYLKKTSFMKLIFKIDGVVNLICDRCSDFFDLELIDDHEIIVKFENERHSNINNDDNDIIFISSSDKEIILDQLFYEYVTLSLPLKQACNLNEKELPTCGKNINYQKLEETEDSNIEEQTTDPRWNELIKLKNKK